MFQRFLILIKSEKNLSVFVYGKSRTNKVNNNYKNIVGILVFRPHDRILFRGNVEWLWVPGSEVLGLGSWVWVSGSWFLGLGSRVQNSCFSKPHVDHMCWPHSRTVQHGPNGLKRRTVTRTVLSNLVANVVGPLIIQCNLDGGFDG